MILRELPKDKDLEFPHIMQVKASAGSGKTYILSLRFLQFLLSDVIPDNSPRRILAITFTNAATEEMRRRILKFLKTLHLKETSEILEKISKITTVSDIKERAGLVIEEILSNFDSFQVRTIDSFVNLIIRASTYELGLPPEYEITSDVRETVELAFARLISKIPSNQRIRKIFFDYIDRLPEPDFKPWEAAKKEVIRFIEFENNFHLPIRSIQTETDSLDELISTLKNQLTELINSFSGDEKKRKKLENALRVLNQRISKSDILEKLASIKSNASDDIQENIEKITNLIMKLNADNVLLLFDEVKNEIESIKSRSRKIFLSELNRQINEFLRDSHPTWIYYKLGESIRHYMIDEFQDTSELQWSNIEPLVENSLASGGSLFFVGDQKQMLYRFRGSSFKTFDLPIQRFGHYKTYRIVLDKNWRSRENIVDFVNSTFDFSNIKKLEESKKPLTGEALRIIKDSYDHVRQEVNGENTGGYVKIKFGKNKDDFEDWLKEVLEDITSRFAFKDIAILLRNNSNVREVSRILMSMDYPVVSSASLDIRNHYVIRAIKSLLTFLDFPPDDMAFAKFITSPVFKELTGVDFEKWLLELRESDDVPLYRRFREQFAEIWDKYLDDLFRGVGYFPPYDLVWQITKNLKLFERYRDAEAFVQKLLDVIYKLEENGALSLKDILERLNYIDDPIFTLDMPVDENAITVMTIHKAKGLEFEVVVTWLNERSWGDTFTIYAAEDSAYLISLKSDFSKGSAMIESMKNRVTSLNTIDNLNALYVAFTRAKSELHVFFSSKNTLKSLVNETEIGEPCRGKPVEQKERPPIQTNYRFIDWTSNLANTVTGAYELKEPIRRGDFIHRVLSRINQLQFFPGELMFESYLKEQIKLVSYELNARDLDFDEIYTSFEKFFSKSSVVKLFEDGDVFTEKEIFNSRGEHLRIDRLVVKDSEIFVVEFKTGEPHLREHELQVKKYMEAVRELYPNKKIRGFLVYFDTIDVLEV